MLYIQTIIYYYKQEEIEEMLQATVDPDKKVINYHEFVTMMLGDETQTN